MSAAEGMPPSVPDHPPAPIGALGQALVKVLGPVTTAVLLVTVGVTFFLVFLGLTAEPFEDAVIAVGEAIGAVPAIVLFAIAAAAWFSLVIAIIAFVPPLLLRGANRDAMAVHSWIGAREVRRTLGRPSRVAEILGTPEAARRWLERTQPTEELRPVRFEALLLLGRFDEARAEAEGMPEGTPVVAYRRLEALAIVDDQTGRPFDEARLREAIAAIPQGADRTEAVVSLAATLARRALPDGDWRAPLLEVRSLIPESDVVLLTRDFSLPIFEVLARRYLLPFLVLILVVVVLTTLAPTILG